MTGIEKSAIWSVMAFYMSIMFFYIWGLFGSVPVVESITLKEEWVVELPFLLSRWFHALDVFVFVGLMGAIWNRGDGTEGRFPCTIFLVIFLFFFFLAISNSLLEITVVATGCIVLACIALMFVGEDLTDIATWMLEVMAFMVMAMSSAVIPGSLPLVTLVLVMLCWFGYGSYCSFFWSAKWVVIFFERRQIKNSHG